MTMNMRRYKPGFERILILAFIVVAVTFALVYLMVPETYRAPEATSEAGLALQAQVSAQIEGALDGGAKSVDVLEPDMKAS